VHGTPPTSRKRKKLGPEQDRADETLQTLRQAIRRWMVADAPRSPGDQDDLLLK
jgi:hypothetical protein